MYLAGNFCYWINAIAPPRGTVNQLLNILKWMLRGEGTRDSPTRSRGYGGSINLN